MRKIKDNSLYLVLTEKYIEKRGVSQQVPVIEAAQQAVSAGVDILQMREKSRSREELVDLGTRLSEICREKGVTFIVNDDPGLAEETGADGVHLGQEDLITWTVERTRGILGKDKIIGISTHSPEQFRAANDNGCDYIAFGPLFPTKTKDYFIGTKDIEKVLEMARKPVIFIGGIDLGNVDTVLGKGAKNIAVIRAILQSGDIRATVKNFKEKLMSADRLAGNKARGTGWR